jgi:hypothetical protein
MNDEIEKEVPPPTGKSATDRKPDPREVLNELRQKVVVALLRLGFSRRTAARHVGVSHTSIARAAARDARFAKELSDAESVADYSALKMVRDAGRQEKYWRAAAWILERRLPDEFGHRAPHSFSGDQVMRLLAEVFSYALPALNDDRKDQFMRSFNGTLREIEAAVQHADRWRDMAADDSVADNGGAADLTPLRSPYEHPDWYEPAPAVPRAMATSRSQRNGKARPAEAGTSSACKNAPAEVGATSAAADVCQSSQEGGVRPVNRIRRKLLAANGLAKPSRSVPRARKPWGGEDNGERLAHAGNGAGH